MFLLFLLPVLVQGCSLPYYIFTPSTAEGTCFFTLEERCPTSYSNVPDREWYASSLSPSGFTLQNSSDTSQPALRSDCKDDYRTTLFVHQVDNATSNPKTFYMWYPVTESQFPAAYPFTVYENKWYQGLRVTSSISTGSKFLITGVDVSKAIVQANVQPRNTRSPEKVETFSGDAIVIVIGCACGLLLVSTALYFHCRLRRSSVNEGR